MKTSFTLSDFADWAASRPPQPRYYAMYSSLWDAVTTDPALMLVPIDDHMVHRGDALFETCKTISGAVYLFPEHLSRLEAGAARLSLPVPPRAKILEICRAVLSVSPTPDTLLRIFLSRGPGGHGASPLECPAPQLYILAIRRTPPFMETHPGGATAALSRVPVKPPPFAAVKSVNYLPNALMKLEAAALGVDFTVGVAPDGTLAECPTENFALVTRDGFLAAPPPGQILEGTTLRRAFDLAQAEISSGGPLSSLLRGVRRTPLTPDDARTARELLILGTTPDATACTRFENRPVGDGLPGPVQTRLNALLLADQRNPASLTPLL